MGSVVLLHGAWHRSRCWEGVVDELERRGITAVAPDLPLSGHPDDVGCARAAIADAGPGCVALAHSYGGLVLSDAASGLDNVARAGGRVEWPTDHSPFLTRPAAIAELLASLG